MAMIHKVVISDRSFTVLDEVQDIAGPISWEYNRLGGCGGFNFQVPIKFCRELTLGLNFNVKVYRRNPSTQDYDLWYQGRIENKVHDVKGEDEVINISGMGYQSALKDVYIDADFSSQEVSVIVKNLLDNYIVPNTDITYDAGDIEATTFTPGTLQFNTDALSAMQTLADLVGTREWGVDRNRKFFFKARSSSVGFRYPLFKNILNFSLDNTSKEIANRIIVIGGETGGSPFTATYNDLTSQLKWKRRDKVIQNSSITTSQVAEQFANAQFSEFNDVSRRCRLELLEERLIENTLPIGLFQIIPDLISYGQMKYGTFLYSGLFNLQVNRVSYRMDDVGNLKISMELGQLRPSIAEDISQLEYEIDQLASQGV